MLNITGELKLDACFGLLCVGLKVGGERLNQLSLHE